MYYIHLKTRRAIYFNWVYMFLRLVPLNYASLSSLLSLVFQVMSRVAEYHKFEWLAEVVENLSV
jgi:hypothetical protein